MHRSRVGHGSRRLLACAAAAITLVPLAIAATAAAEQQEPTCADVVILTMVGSGQDGQTIASPLDMVVSAFEGRVRSAEVTVESIPVDYPAEPTRSLFEPGPGGSDRFFTSMETGTANLVRELEARASACPSQQYVMLGYSQGAMSVQAAATQIPLLASRVSAIGLVASGDRKPSWDATEYGTSQRGDGITHAFLGIDRAPLTRDVASRVLSLCSRHDIVCDYRAWSRSFRSPSDGLIIHNSYSKKDTSAIGRALADKVLQTAIPTVSTVSVNAGPTQPVSIWLTARSFGRTGPTWRLAAKYKLPRGLKLTKDGHLTGSAGAGSSTVKVEVAGRAEGVWLPVILNITIATGPADPPPSGPHTTVDLVGIVRMSTKDADGTEVVPVGTPVTASYTFPTSTPDSNPDPDGGDYWSRSPGMRFTVSVDGMVFSSNPTDPEMRQSVGNRRGDSGDFFVLHSYNNVPVDAFPDYHLSWQLNDRTGQALTSDAQLAGPPDLAAWGRSTFGLNITENEGENFLIRVDVITATQRG